jgi:hypothetical protein
LNQSVLDTDQLSQGLVLAKRLQRELHELGHVLPNEYANTIRAAELIKLVRDCVRSGRWAEAASAFHSIREERLPASVPIIQEEVLCAAGPINNYLAITVCKNALSKGMGRGEVGAMMYSLIDVDSLSAAVRTCMDAGATKSSHADALIRAVVAVGDIRRAQKNRDWGELSDALRRADAAGIGTGLTALCAKEIARAKVEQENVVMIELLRTAVIEEEMPTFMSLLHTGHISTTKVREALRAVGSMAAQPDRVGPVLQRLCSLLEVCVKARAEANKGDTLALKSLKNVWEDALADLR